MRTYLLIWGACIALFLSCEQRPDTLFQKLSPKRTGIDFQNTLRQTEDFNVLNYSYFFNGGGVAIGDLNNDGLADLYFTGNMVAGRMYLNEGNWKFREVAEESGTTAAGLWNTGVTMADVNADGWLDIYVCRSAANIAERRQNLLFINRGAEGMHDGTPTFTESAAQYGINDSGYSTHSAFFDYDRDGDLDLYVLNHSVPEYAGFSRIDPSFKQRENANYGDRLYRNDGKGFTDVTKEAGLISNVLGFGLGLAVADVNRDGWPDIYVSNDYNEEDYLYLNGQDGTFRESLAEMIDHTSLFSMGNDIADVNNDGLPDIMSLDMLPEDPYRIQMTSGPDHYQKYRRLLDAGFYPQTMRNMFHLNNGDGTFSEIGQVSGISNTDWSWAALFADLDLDGHEDLFVSNGYAADFTNMDFISYAANEKIQAEKIGREAGVAELLQHIPSVEVPNYAFRQIEELKFEDATSKWGLDDPSLSNGAVFGDLDNDGDLDLVVNNINSPAGVYRNQAERLNRNHYLRIKLRGSGGNTSGIGSEVCLFIGEKMQCRELMPSRGFQSSVEPVLSFGLGPDSLIDKINIRWPDGSFQELRDIRAGQLLEVGKDAGTRDLPPLDEPGVNLVRGSEADLLPFRHIENAFVDFDREALLPRMLSRLGPRLATGDLDGDGLEDVFVGGAKGQVGAVFLQTGAGGFERVLQATLEAHKNSEDTDAALFDADGDGDLDLYVVSGGMDFDADDVSLQDRLYRNDGKGNLTFTEGHLPEMLTSGSCVSVADYDGDGDQDLFVGGRVIPGQYPEAPRSYVLQNNGRGKFSDQTKTLSNLLYYPGMVTDALWTDFDSNGLTDLLIVGEWMMPVLLRQTLSGKFEFVDLSTSGLDNSKGWWNRIAAADFDEDGDLDYVLANEGSNSQLKATKENQLALFASDFDENGSIDPVLAQFVDGKFYPVYSRDDMLKQIPSLKPRFVRYEDYARADLLDILGSDAILNAMSFFAETFASSYMENKGNGSFEITPLPSTAQFAPMYAVETADLNNDGYEDILLGGNTTSTRVKFGPHTASKGVILLGDGSGHFRSLSPLESGLSLRGEVRDLKIIKRADGTLVLLVANNDAELEVLHCLTGEEM